MSFFMHIEFLYVLLGVFSGFFSGLFGIGGGVVVVPALLALFQTTVLIPLGERMAFAIGTSLAIMIFVSFASVYSHHKLGEILWVIVRRLWPGMCIGVILGSIGANYLPTDWLRIFFGLFLLFISWKMLFVKDASVARHFPSMLLHSIVTMGIGIFSGLLGIGGGTLLLFYLTYCGVELSRIPAISAVCSLLIALTGTLAFMLMGFQAQYHVPFSTGAIYWPAVFWVTLPSFVFAPIGARLTYHLPVKQLRYAFVGLLLMTAFDLLA